MTGPGGGFALQLCALREAQGLSVRALADLVGVSKVTIWKWERGDNEPRERHLRPLALALDVSPDQLLPTTKSYKKFMEQAATEIQASSELARPEDLEPGFRDQAGDLRDVIEKAKQMIADATGSGPKNITFSIEF